MIYLSHLFKQYTCLCCTHDLYVTVFGDVHRPTDAEARIVKIRVNGFIVFVPKYVLFTAISFLFGLLY